LIANNRPLLDRITAALMEYETLTHEQIMKLYHNEEALVQG
jgi:ATP-dependent Zn protease